jgi:hypothetical protein
MVRVLMAGAKRLVERRRPETQSRRNDGQPLAAPCPAGAGPIRTTTLRILLHLRHLPPPGPSTSASVEAVPISPNEGAAQLPDAMVSHAVHGVLR